MLTFEITLKEKGIICESEENWNRYEKTKTSKPLFLKKIRIVLDIQSLENEW